MTFARIGVAEIADSTARRMCNEIVDQRMGFLFATVVLFLLYSISGTLPPAPRLARLSSSVAMIMP